MHVDTSGCLAGEVLLRIWEIKTRNRLEYFHGKVKAYLHPNMTLSNCVDELLHFDRRKEIQTSHKVIDNARTLQNGDNGR